MASIPGRRRPRAYERKAVLEALSVVPPIVTGAVAAKASLADPGKVTLGWLLAGAIGWLGVASVLKVWNAHVQDREEKKSQDYEGLFGALHVLHSAVRGCAGREDLPDGTLRVTIHRVVPHAKKRGAAEELEQLLPYVGGRGSHPGRTFSIRSGIIGKAVRERTAFAASRRNDDHAQFLAELVRDWSYTEEDARALSSDRRAWMAVPIFGSDSSVVAVVYLDSNEREFFGGDLQRFIVEVCEGIATYISETY